MKPLARPVGAVSAVGAGGAVLVSTGLLIPHLPPVLSAMLIGADLAAVVVLTWLLNRRQVRAQEGRCISCASCAHAELGLGRGSR